MTDEQIWPDLCAGARLTQRPTVVPDPGLSVPHDAPANLVRHRTLNPNMAFWKMLKEGNDHFEVTHLQPKVEVS